jgi:hypothetical protein
MASDSPLPGKVSLVIAITGHRDLHPEDLGSLEAEVGKIFKDMRDAYPKTPLLLLSGLAEGADRLAVRAARAASVPYMAVLPMPEDLYRKDFGTSESISEFEEQWNNTNRRLVLPLLEASRAEVADQGPARDLQYLRLGEFLVNYSQIMIAIWDKKRTGSAAASRALSRWCFRTNKWISAAKPALPRRLKACETCGSGRYWFDGRIWRCVQCEPSSLAFRIQVAAIRRDPPIMPLGS